MRRVCSARTSRPAARGIFDFSIQVPGYDCTVDDTESPVNFCIFRDFQAMPTYLLEFTTELRGRDQRTMTTRAS
ncbi:unnamed protein product [Cladocopium goreaui]|uniref:Uncharacterized protein n=1 Tax=Cladocopium goreaui TaxID=2562237 RepID=A0A9P1BHK2_9DINO|nr:unnamed protein product [Cladocopium goreaui]